MGDPAGIGPELIVKLYQDPNPLVRHMLQNTVVVADVACMRRAKHLLGCQTPICVLADLQDAAHAPPNCMLLIQGCEPLAGDGTLATDGLPAWGQISASAGLAAAQCIAWATHAALTRQAIGMVTCPIHKEAFQAAGMPHPGHTEYLQALSAEHLGIGTEQLPVRMMLANHELKTVLLSIHVPLQRAIDMVTTANVLDTLKLIHAHWPTAKPRIAVAGLNPHAGEGGIMGTQEMEHIAPAIALAQAQGIDASGPWAPDTVFMRARKGEFDVVLAMYHDQGLIPVKYMGLDHGVNVTLGLPLLRTSPDHGTAFDIAGTGKASPDSLLAACRWLQRAVGVDGA
jgi:4-hydroxythreonine-4-phosphate dehydrogenase